MYRERVCFAVKPAEEDASDALATAARLRISVLGYLPGGFNWVPAQQAWRPSTPLRARRLQKRSEIRLDRSELFGNERDLVPAGEGVRWKVAFNGSVTAVEDAGGSDFADALREQRSFGCIHGDARIEVQVADAGIVTGDGIGINS